MHKNIRICDTTLRDGEQMPGVVFSPKEKLKLAEKISEFGCHLMEMMPTVSKIEEDTTRKMVKMGLDISITASTMLRKEHVDVAIDCGVDSVTLFTPVSDLHLKHKLGISRKENIRRAVEIVDYCQEHGIKVNFAGEDSVRADKNYLMEFIKTVEKKIDYFLPCDTVGSLTPFETYSFIRRLREGCKCAISLHCHNDFGMATANTIAGMHAGAEVFSGTFSGIGERAGNAAIEEVCVALKYLYDIDIGVKYKMLGKLCEMVSKYSKVKLQPHKPVVGVNAFSHESGIHTDGVIKHPQTYEFYNPDDIGVSRRFVFGKHSGKAVLRHILGKVSNEEIDMALSRVKHCAEVEKRGFSEAEALEICRPCIRTGPLAMV